MDILVIVTSAVLLSFERVTYWWVWNRPATFEALVSRYHRLLSGDPVEALRRLFLIFKTVQIAVLMGWCMWFGRTLIPYPVAPAGAAVTGLVLIAIGQLLNATVFRRLGRSGVFYGNRFGRSVEWQYGFPFSFLPHPQYLGAALSVWGFFLLMRYPNPDWVVLPLLLSGYYAAGAHVERHIPPERE